MAGMTAEEKKTFSISEVARMMSKTEMTIRRWCKSGKLLAERLPGKKNKEWKIDCDSVLEFLGEKKSGSQKREPIESPVLEREKVAGALADSGEITDDLSVMEAERLWKIERARKERRNNEEAAGKLVLAESLLAEWKDLFSLLQENLREQIDLWVRKFELGPVANQAMHSQVQQILLETARRIKEKVERSSE